MFTRLIAKNVFFVRGSRDLFKKGSGSSTTLGTTGNFPYRIGGVDNHLPNEQSIQAFGQERKEEFISTYKKLLDSIEHRDHLWLEGKAEPQLVEPLLSRQDLIQVNRESSVQLLFNSMSLGIGVPFKRRDTSYNLLIDKSNVAMYTIKDQDPSEMMKYMTSGMPVLISFNMTVRSSRKLVPKDTESKGQQFHLLTMEQQANVELTKMMKVMSKMDDQALETFRKLILGSNEPWHIGNIDDFLKKRF